MFVNLLIYVMAINLTQITGVCTCVSSVLSSGGSIVVLFKLHVWHRM